MKVGIIFERIYYFFDYIIKRALGLTEIILFIRFLLKGLGASPSAIVVSELYKITDYIVWPFNSIFPNTTFETYYIDIVTLSAMVGYAFGVFILLQILKVLTRE